MLAEPMGRRIELVPHDGRPGNTLVFNDAIQPVDDDERSSLVLERSGLRDEIEKLQRTKGATLASGVAITALFIGGSMFMERSTTALFLGVMWIAFTLRLVAMNRSSDRELRLKETTLPALADPEHDGA